MPLSDKRAIVVATLNCSVTLCRQWHCNHSQVNELLDEMANIDSSSLRTATAADAVDTKQRLGRDGAKVLVLRKMYNRATSCELKWLMRLVLKAVKLSIGREGILGVLHPEASTEYSSTNDLRWVCTAFAAGQRKAESIRPGCAFWPMLAASLGADVVGVSRRFKQNPFVMDVSST
jgi:DNA ligase N terminus